MYNMFIQMKDYYDPDNILDANLIDITSAKDDPDTLFGVLIEAQSMDIKTEIEIKRDILKNYNRYTNTTVSAFENMVNMLCALWHMGVRMSDKEVSAENQYASLLSLSEQMLKKKSLNLVQRRIVQTLGVESAKAFTNEMTTDKPDTDINMTIYRDPWAYHSKAEYETMWLDSHSTGLLFATPVLNPLAKQEPVKNNLMIDPTRNDLGMMELNYLAYAVGPRELVTVNNSKLVYTDDEFDFDVYKAWNS